MSFRHTCCRGFTFSQQGNLTDLGSVYDNHPSIRYIAYQQEVCRLTGRVKRTGVLLMHRTMVVTKEVYNELSDMLGQEATVRFVEGNLAMAEPYCLLSESEYLVELGDRPCRRISDVELEQVYHLILCGNLTADEVFQRQTGLRVTQGNQIERIQDLYARRFIKHRTNNKRVRFERDLQYALRKDD